MSQYWQAQTEGFQRGLGNLAGGLARLPMARAQGTMLQQRGALYGQEAAEAAAKSGLIGAQTEGEQAKTADLLKKGALVDALQRTAPAALRAMQSGKMDDPSIDDFTGAASALTGYNKGDIQKSMATGLGTILAASGNTSTAAAVENPVSVQNNSVNAAERTARPVTVPTGGTLMTPAGQPLGTGGVTLSPGQNRFGPQSLAGALQSSQGNLDTSTDPDAIAGDQTSAAPPLVAQGQPLPIKPAKSEAPQLPASVLAPLFKQALANSNGGTNTVQAVQAVLDANKAAGTGVAPTAQTAAGVPTISSQADYDALPSGASYRDSTGKLAVKKGK